jgi:hypothetical protein
VKLELTSARSEDGAVNDNNAPMAQDFRDGITSRRRKRTPGRIEGGGMMFHGLTAFGMVAGEKPRIVRLV